jgi:hypothetical protein
MALVSALKVTHVNGVALTTAFEFTEHNRSSIPLSYEYIESAERMANGYMRKFVVAKKASFSVSWSELPSPTLQTVDGKPGAAGIKNFYDLYYGDKLTVVFTHYNTEVEGAITSTDTVDMYISSFSYEISKRLTTSAGGYDRVNVSIGFLEA